MPADRPNRVDRSKEPKLRPRIGELVEVQAAEQPPSDQQLRAAAEAVSAREGEAKGTAALQKLFPDYLAQIDVDVGGGRRRKIDGAFEGRFRGREGRWIVEFSTAELISNRFRLVLRPDYFSIYGDDNYDGVLFVVPDTSADRRDLAQYASDVFPGKLIEIATVPEIEDMYSVADLFDSSGAEYPGRIVEIGHNSGAYYTAIETIDAIASQLCTSNSLDLRADVRDRLLVEVQAGRTLLEATTVRVAALGNTIVPALKFIAENCAKAVVGELAKEALRALAKLIFG